MAKVMAAFISILLVQLFFSLGITLYTNALPAETLTYVQMFSDVTEEINLQETSNKVENSLNQQSDIPVVDVGALVFQSGNILADLLLNFFFAIPEMIGLIINGLLVLFSIDENIALGIIAFAQVMISIIYFLGVTISLLSIRSGRVIE